MTPRNFTILSSGFFTASMLGFWILFFVLPDVRPLTAPERAIWIVGFVLTIPALPFVLPAGFLLPPQTEELTILICCLISALFWSFLISLIWQRSSPKGSEPGSLPAGSQEEFRRLLDEHRKRMTEQR